MVAGQAEVIAEGEHQIGLKYSHFQIFSSQALDRISVAFPPLSHRILAGYPPTNPQIFRAFSASFAHVVVRLLFRNLCAVISQDLTY
ncbi:MAG: hypothetical protein DMF59_14685 [Acidobacteria bacterium]|nr:MAG: hypothetical protein DMF59_14685 [Acidobacteriota bacterium]